MKYFSKKKLIFSFLLLVNFLFICSETFSSEMVINDFRSPVYNNKNELVAELFGRKAIIDNSNETKINDLLINFYEKSDITAKIYSPESIIKSYATQNRDLIIIESNSEVLIKYDNSFIYGRGYNFNSSEETIKIDSDTIVFLESEIIKERKNLNKDVNNQDKFKFMIDSLQLIKEGNLNTENYYIKGDHLNFNRTERSFFIEGRTFTKFLNQKIYAEKISYNSKNNNKIIFEPNAFIEAKNLFDNNEISDIRANKIIMDYYKNNVEFFGDVRMRNYLGAVNSDQMFFEIDNQQNLKFLSLTSNVIMKFNDFLLSCDKMTYFSESDKIKFIGYPKLMNKNNVVTCDIINYWPKTGKILCEPNVKMIFYPNVKDWKNISNELNEF